MSPQAKTPGTLVWLSAPTATLPRSVSLTPSPEALQACGYAPLEIPNVDARIAACHSLVGRSQVECWAASVPALDLISQYPG